MNPPYLASQVSLLMNPQSNHEKLTNVSEQTQINERGRMRIYLLRLGTFLNKVFLLLAVVALKVGLIFYQPVLLRFIRIILCFL